MENDLVFSPTTHAMVGHLFAVALGAHLVGLVYFAANSVRIAPRYRIGTLLSVAVMLASGYLFYRLQQSWDTAFVQQGTRMVRSGNRFDGALRYVNWFVTVPVLLVQVLYAFDLPRDRVLRLRAVLVGSGVLMVLCGYVGQFRAGRDDGWVLLWGALGTLPFVVLLAVLLRQLQAARQVLPVEAGRTAGNLRWVFLFFWGLYPLAYLVPVVSVTDEAVVVEQGLFTAADIGSKVLYGVLLAKLLRLRSAADGYEQAREPGQGAVGHRPEDEPYRDDPVRSTDREEMRR